LGPKGGGGSVRVVAHPERGGTEISVIDDGVGFEPGRARPSSGIGIGMDNVNQRLTKLFGPASALRVTSSPGAGTTVTFRVPARVPMAAR
jgi:sensor histidine kinase YesM